MIVIADTLSFTAGGCTWFQPKALDPEAVERFRIGLETSDRLWTTFYDWQAPPSRDEFLALMTRETVLSWFGFDTGSGEPLAFFWLEPAGATARINFALMPGCTGRRAIRVGCEATDQILETGWPLGLRALMGETPTANPAAVKFARACGLKPLGIIPHGCFMAETGEFCGRLVTCKTTEG